MGSDLYDDYLGILFELLITMKHTEGVPKLIYYFIKIIVVTYRTNDFHKDEIHRHGHS